MLYNFKKEKMQTQLDCFECEFFDKKQKRCNGIGKCCFEYDTKTKTVLDPVTKLPLNIEKIKELKGD